MTSSSTFFAKYATWRFACQFTYRTGLFYCVAHTVGGHVGEIVLCKGPSMMPTVLDGDIILAERFSVKMNKLQRGDIVGCLNPHDHHQLLCKRLIGMERDRAILHGEDSEQEVLQIPIGHVFLEGDNTDASSDSRHFGPVPLGLVQLRLSLRIWPLHRFGWVSERWWFETAEEAHYRLLKKAVQ